MSKSDFQENRILNAEFGNTAFTQDDPIYLALFSAAPSDTGGGTELTGNGYARIAVETGANSEWNTASAGVVDNTNEIVYTASGGNWSEVVAMGQYDALTGGNLTRWDFLGTLEYIATGLDTGDVFTAPGHTLANGDRVVLRPRVSSALPGGVAANTIYFVIGVSGNTFQVSLTSGGAAIALTSDGAATVKKIEPVQINDGSDIRFAAGAIDIIED